LKLFPPFLSEQREQSSEEDSRLRLDPRHQCLLEIEVGAALTLVRLE
jgi:hypothetical protein